MEASRRGSPRSAEITQAKLGDTSRSGFSILRVHTSGIFISSRSAILLLVCLLILASRAGFAQPYAYIANTNNGTVSVIDTASNTVTTTVTIGAGTGPFGVAFNPAGTRVYVANNNGTVSVIDTASNTVTATIPLTSAWGIAVNPAGTRVYVTTTTSNAVAIIDAATNTVTTTISLGANSGPTGIALTPDGAHAYVATNAGVAVIDTATNVVTSPIVVGSFPRGVAVNPAGTRVYVTNQLSDSVSVIDTATNTVVTTVTVGAAPYGVAVNPAGTRVYVGNNNGNTVSVIDTASNTVVATVAVGTTPYGVAVTPAGDRVYVANGATDNVSAIDTASNTVVATVAVGDGPTAFGLFIGGPTVSTPVLSISDVAHNEGNSGTTDFNFTVSLSATPTSMVTVNWQTADGTAVAGSDYVAGSGTLTWNVGDPLTQQVTVKANGDTVVEADETFTVSLSSPSGATIGKGTGTGTILSDDTVSSGISISPSPVVFANQEVGISSSAATVTVTNIGAVNLSITGASITPLGEFTTQSNTCVTTLNPSASCSIALVFTPGAVGTRTATLLIASSNAPTGNYLVPLSGKGVQIQSVPVPTLSTWGLVSLSALLGMLGIAATLRRRAEPS